MNPAIGFKPDIPTVRNLLSYFKENFREIGDEITKDPEPGTIGHRDMQDPRYKTHIMTAIDITELMCQLTYDYLCAGALLHRPDGFSQFAFGANARTSMECAARARWLMSPDCDAKERSLRSLRVRMSGLHEQVKALKSRTRGDVQIVVKIEQEAAPRIARITDQAKAIGCNSLNKMPVPTELISSELDMEPMYRLLSGLAHGHWYAAKSIGFEVDPESQSNIAGDGRVRAYLKANPEAVGLSAWVLCHCHAVCIWYSAKFRLADTLRIEKLIDDGFDIIDLPDSRRFWRSR